MKRILSIVSKQECNNTIMYRQVILVLNDKYTSQELIPSHNQGLRSYNIPRSANIYIYIAIQETKVNKRKNVIEDLTEG